jgi:hypothetical protein
VWDQQLPEVNSAEGQENPVREHDIQNNETYAGTDSFCAEQGRGIIDSEGGDEEDMLTPIASDVVTRLSNVSIKKVP